MVGVLTALSACVRGYDFTVIPDDYVVLPPTDIKLVRRNLDILQKALHTTDGKPDSKLFAFVSELKDEIYPHIEKLKKELEVVAQGSVHMPVV